MGDVSSVNRVGRGRTSLDLCSATRSSCLARAGVHIAQHILAHKRVRVLSGADGRRDLYLLSPAPDKRTKEARAGCGGALSYAIVQAAPLITGDGYDD